LRSYIQQWNSNVRKSMPYATESVYDFESSFLASVMVFDIQQLHTTRCSFPAPDAPDKQESWFYFQGEKGTVSPEVFDVANFIRGGR
jgi:hypothetical protein